MAQVNPTHLYLDVDYLGSAEAFVDEVLTAINKEVLFDEFYRYEIEELCQFMHCFGAPTGTVLLQEGEAGDHLILLLSGRVIVRKTDLAGKAHSLAMVGEGSILGEMSLIDGEPRFASCITLAPTLFAVLDRDGLTRLIAEQPKTGIKLLMELVMLLNQRLRTVSGELLKCLDNQRLRIR